MTSRTLTLYLHPTTASRLAFAKRHGRTAGEEVRLLAEIVNEVERLALPADILESQWALMVDVIGDTRIESLRDIRHLPYLVEDALRGGDLARRHKVDGDRLPYRLRALKFPELVAVCTELQRRRLAGSEMSGAARSVDGDASTASAESCDGRDDAPS